jgi:integrase
MATIERYMSASGQVRYRVRYRTPERRQTDKRGFITKRDAQAFATSVATSIMRGAYIAPDAGKVTFDELYEAWATARTRPKASTRAKEASTWATHLRDRWGPVAIANITTAAVRRWVADLINEGAKTATVENALGMLRMVLDSAVEDNRLLRNPCSGVKPPRRTHADRGYLTHRQVAALAKELAVQPVAVRGGVKMTARPQHALVVRLLAYTGLRWGEMAALKVRSLDLQRRRIQVTEAVAEVRGHLVWSTPKGHERRSVPFPAFLTEDLQAQVAGKARDDLVFTSKAGTVLRVSRFRPYVFAPAVERCRAADPMFPAITPHDLRHSAASLAISVGANVKAVQTMLGHKSAALTLDTYADLFPDDLDAVASALNSAVIASERDD